MPLLECSSCGEYVGPFYDDYYKLSKKLINDLAGRDVPTDSYVTKEGDDIGPYIKTYYEWLTDEQQVVNATLPEHTPGNIVARGLLRLRELEPEHLPFGSQRAADGQMSIFETRICCLRMFQTDPAGTEMPVVNV